MKTVEEFADNARQCRELAKKMPQPKDRERLEEMAKAWERLAHVRKGKLLAGAEPSDI